MSFRVGDLVGTMKKDFRTSWGIQLRPAPDVMRSIVATSYHDLWIVLAVRHYVSRPSGGPWYQVLAARNLEVCGWTRDEGLLWHIDELIKS